MKRSALLVPILLLAACSPAQPTDPRAAAGTWPPKDYAEFTARPPMSVGAELDDEWTMAIEAERWSYVIGVAIVAVDGTPPPHVDTNATTSLLKRTEFALHGASARLKVLHDLTCRAEPIAKPDDCEAFALLGWTSGSDSKDQLQARLQWFEANAYKFVQPACAVAIKRTGDERYCVAE